MFGFINQKKLVQKAVACGIGEALYIIFAATFLFSGNKLFPENSEMVVFGIVAMLILLVVGVGISGLLVLGFPFYYALNRKYQEALLSLVTTLGTLCLVFVLIVLASFIIF